ncbi:MAG: ABC transporter substrate-binding protein [Chloroflexota bacterium]
MRRSTLWIIAAVAAVVLVAGVGFSKGWALPTPGSERGDQVTIEYWDWWVTQGPTIDKEIALFEEAHPNIKIKKTTQVVDKYPELLQLAIKGGTAPDVFLVPDKPKLLDQVKQGWLLPLNQWATDEWKAQYPSDAFAEGANVFDGKVYTAPYEGPAPWLQFYINAKLFREAGLVDENGEVKVPQTWAEVRESARIITEKGQGKYFGYGFGNKQKFALPWHMWMVQNSGAADAGGGFDSRTGRYVWSSNPVYADWIEFVMGLKEDGSIVPNAMSMDDEMARSAFAEGRFAMTVGGVWNQGGWEKTNPDFKDYMVVDLPHQGTQKDSYFYRSPGGQGWAISAQTKHPEEAWLWFEWLNSKDAATRWVQANHSLRAQPEANKIEYAKTPQFAQYMKLAADGTRLAPAPQLKHPEMNEVKAAATKPSIQDILEGVYTGQIGDYEAALYDLEQRDNASLDQAIADAEASGVKLDRSWWKVTDWDLTKDYRN